jgi:hypothetical protein
MQTLKEIFESKETKVEADKILNNKWFQIATLPSLVILTLCIYPFVLTKSLTVSIKKKGN